MFMSKWRFAAPVLAAALLVTPLSASRAQANVSFSGGSGSPLTFTLLSPVRYTITTAVINELFLFKGIGNVYPGFPSITSSLTYTVNSGAPRAVTSINSGFTTGALNATDAYVFGVPSFTALGVGDVVTLQGAFTTTGNVAAATPASKAYQTFMFGDNTGGESIPTRISTDGIPVSTVPEPSTYALMAAGLAVMGVVARRRRVA